MLHSAHLHDRHDKSDFFCSIFFYFVLFELLGIFVALVNISKIEKTILKIPCLIIFLLKIVV